ncbi:hypothetical protein [Salinibacterium sp. ZJ450]|uniref:hypothetical protein n=1 Tax=Salinibacterium sp. ZJ450 TaxID=2708338 RepID=UPI00141DE766|nr:hypothetical protein [Salinibacterium sp. ZJ450]
MSTSRAFATVHDTCVAFRDGEITEDDLVAALAALPAIKQAALPSQAWFDAIVVEHGPVYQLRREVYSGIISANTYSRAVQAMLDAGHAA